MFFFLLNNKHSCMFYFSLFLALFPIAVTYCSLPFAGYVVAYALVSAYLCRLTTDAVAVCGLATAVVPTSSPSPYRSYVRCERRTDCCLLSLPCHCSPSSYVVACAHADTIQHTNKHAVYIRSTTKYQTTLQNYRQRRNQGTVHNSLSKDTAANSSHNATFNPQQTFGQSADFQPNTDTMSSELCKNIRDRLGLWGTLSESEVAGNVSGLERLRSARFNKVSNFAFYFYTLWS